MGYATQDIPGDPKVLEDVIEWVRNELKGIEATFNIQDFVQLKVHHVEPVRPRAGMVVYADGSDWDPGGGEGIYAYHGGAWNLLG